MQRKILATIGVLVLLLGTITGMAFALNDESVGDVEEFKVQVSNEDETIVNRWNLNSVNNSKSADYRDMLNIMRTNGFATCSRYMQTGNFDDMDQWMNNLSPEDFEEMKELMEEAGFTEMSEMMESYGVDGMINMHNSTSGFRNRGMMGN
jgi:hypothetical protein